MRTKQTYPVKSSSTYRLYSPTAMTNAYRAVKEQQMSVCRAAVQFDVPTTTLRQRVRGKVDPDVTASGPSPVLSQEEEAMFVEHLKFMASVGYGYTRMEVVNMASEYAVCLRKHDEEHPFSLKWFQNFMRRWPQLNVSKPRALSLARAKATSQEVVAKYFRELEAILLKNNLTDKPHHIYNVDEKGLQTEHSPPYVVGTMESTTPAITSSRSAITTVIGCGNALGVQIPPYFIFKGQRMREELLNGCSPGADGTVTASGWSNRDVFEHYLQNHFLKYVQGRDKDQPILIYDGHKSHMSLPLINWARKHNLILFVLPAHTSHVLQPLDVGCFGPFQRIYNSECHKFMRLNPSSRITRYNVCSLACKAYTHALSPDNLKAAFKKSGIYPLDSSAVDSSHFKPATVFTNKKQSATATQHAEPEGLQDNVEDHTSDPSLGDFFAKKLDCIRMKSENTNERRNMSEIVSGRAITDDTIVEQLEDYQNSGKQCQKKAVKRKSPSLDKEKKVSKDPKPGPSGLQVINISESGGSSSIDEDEDEKCCVCNRFQPIELTNCVSLVFTKWAQCDLGGCGHWTHLQFCCPQRVLRRGDKFFCPCHVSEE